MNPSGRGGAERTGSLGSMGSHGSCGSSLSGRSNASSVTSMLSESTIDSETEEQVYNSDGFSSVSSSTSNLVIGDEDDLHNFDNEEIAIPSDNENLFEEEELKEPAFRTLQLASSDLDEIDFGDDDDVPFVPKQQPSQPTAPILETFASQSEDEDWEKEFGADTTTGFQNQLKSMLEENEESEQEGQGDLHGMPARHRLLPEETHRPPPLPEPASAYSVCLPNEPGRPFTFVGYKEEVRWLPQLTRQHVDSPDVGHCYNKDKMSTRLLARDRLMQTTNRPNVKYTLTWAKALYEYCDRLHGNGDFSGCWRVIKATFDDLKSATFVTEHEKKAVVMTMYHILHVAACLRGEVPPPGQPKQPDPWEQPGHPPKRTSVTNGSDGCSLAAFKEMASVLTNMCPELEDALYLYELESLGHGHEQSPKEQLDLPAKLCKLHHATRPDTLRDVWEEDGPGAFESSKQYVHSMALVDLTLVLLNTSPLTCLDNALTIHRGKLPATSAQLGLGPIASPIPAMSPSNQNGDRLIADFNYRLEVLESLYHHMPINTVARSKAALALALAHHHNEQDPAEDKKYSQKATSFLLDCLLMLDAAPRPAPGSPPVIGDVGIAALLLYGDINVDTRTKAGLAAMESALTALLLRPNHLLAQWLRMKYAELCEGLDWRKSVGHYSVIMDQQAADCKVNETTAIAFKVHTMLMDHGEYAVAEAVIQSTIQTLEDVARKQEQQQGTVRGGTISEGGTMVAIDWHMSQLKTRLADTYLAANHLDSAIELLEPMAKSRSVVRRTMAQKQLVVALTKRRWLAEAKTVLALCVPRPERRLSAATGEGSNTVRGDRNAMGMDSNQLKFGTLRLEAIPLSHLRAKVEYHLAQYSEALISCDETLTNCGSNVPLKCAAYLLKAKVYMQYSRSSHPIDLPLHLLEPHLDSHIVPRNKDGLCLFNSTQQFVDAAVWYLQRAHSACQPFIKPDGDELIVAKIRTTIAAVQLDPLVTPVLLQGLPLEEFASTDYLAKIEEQARRGLESARARCSIPLVFLGQVAMAEVCALQQRDSLALQYWQEARDHFLSLYVAGSRLVVGLNASIGLVTKLYELARRMLRFLFSLDATFINANLALIDVYLQLQLLLDRWHKEAPPRQTREPEGSQTPVVPRGTVHMPPAVQVAGKSNTLPSRSYGLAGSSILTDMGSLGRGPYATALPRHQSERSGLAEHLPQWGLHMDRTGSLSRSLSDVAGSRSPVDAKALSRLQSMDHNEEPLLPANQDAATSLPTVSSVLPNYKSSPPFRRSSGRRSSGRALDEDDAIDHVWQLMQRMRRQQRMYSGDTEAQTMAQQHRENIVRIRRLLAPIRAQAPLYAALYAPTRAPAMPDHAAAVTTADSNPVLGLGHGATRSDQQVDGLPLPFGELCPDYPQLQRMLYLIHMDNMIISYMPNTGAKKFLRLGGRPLLGDRGSQEVAASSTVCVRLFLNNDPNTCCVLRVHAGVNVEQLRAHLFHEDTQPNMQHQIEFVDHSEDFNDQLEKLVSRSKKGKTSNVLSFATIPDSRATAYTALDSSATLMSAYDPSDLRNCSELDPLPLHLCCVPAGQEVRCPDIIRELYGRPHAPSRYRPTILPHDIVSLMAAYFSDVIEASHEPANNKQGQDTLKQVRDAMRMTFGSLIDPLLKPPSKDQAEVQPTKPGSANFKLPNLPIFTLFNNSNDDVRPTDSDFSKPLPPALVMSLSLQALPFDLILDHPSTRALCLADIINAAKTPPSSPHPPSTDTSSSSSTVGLATGDVTGAVALVTCYHSDDPASMTSRQRQQQERLQHAVATFWQRMCVNAPDTRCPRVASTWLPYQSLVRFGKKASGYRKNYKMLAFVDCTCIGPNPADLSLAIQDNVARGKLPLLLLTTADLIDPSWSILSLLAGEGGKQCSVMFVPKPKFKKVVRLLAKLMEKAGKKARHGSRDGPSLLEPRIFLSTAVQKIRKEHATSVVVFNWPA